MQAQEITPRISIAGQPTAEDLAALKAEGYTGVVNLRHDGEPEQPLSSAAEGDLVRQDGLEYLHYAVGGAPLTFQGVAAVCDLLDRHADGKVLVHCKRGGRALALVLLHLAKSQNWPTDEVITRGQASGITLDGGLRQLVQLYLDQQG